MSSISRRGVPHRRRRHRRGRSSARAPRASSVARRTAARRRRVGATGAEPFYGAHQAGIATAQQDRLFFAATTSPRRGGTTWWRCCSDWTAAAARHDRGRRRRPGGRDQPDAPPTDTGEAIGPRSGPPHPHVRLRRRASSASDGIDRYGLAWPAAGGARRPPGTSPATTSTRPTRGGDLCVQACSNDPQVAYHAIRNLTRIARGTAVLRWTQQGFGRTSSTTSDQVTPRNLMGFKDGTNNIHAEHVARSTTACG